MLNLDSDEIEKQHAALELASIILEDPGMAPVADRAMREAQAELGGKIAALSQTAQPQPAQPQMQPA
jgi:hypothetical protein